MINDLINEMVDAGVHYGHQTKKWNPRMKPFLMKDKGGIYIIDLEKTVQQLDKASDFLADLVGKGKKVLFVGCKRQAQDAIREAAEATGQFYVNHRWLGGMLTNSLTVRKSVERLKYLENIEKQPEFKAMSKKELAALGREREKLLRNLRGVRDMDKKPDAVVIVDSARETIAVAEARRLNIPIIAIVDTNAGTDDAVVTGLTPDVHYDWFIHQYGSAYTVLYKLATARPEVWGLLFSPSAQRDADQLRRITQNGLEPYEKVCDVSSVVVANRANGGVIFWTLRLYAFAALCVVGAAWSAVVVRRGVGVLTLLLTALGTFELRELWTLRNPDSAR